MARSPSGWPRKWTPSRTRPRCGWSCSSGWPRIARLLTPAGRWAIELREDGRLIGGATLLPLAPDDEFEIGWQLSPAAWGHGYAAETGLALAQWAFDQGIEQVIAVVRPTNKRAEAMVRRIGMEWVGETEKYHNLRLQVFRLRPGDLTGP